MTFHKSTPLKNAMQNSGKPTRDVLIARHGSTHLNKASKTEDKLKGQSNVPIDESGKKEAESLGKKLKGAEIDHIVSSDLERAHETAKIVSKIIGAPIEETTKDFRPWDVGKMVGTITSVALPRLKEYSMKNPNKPVEGGESFNSFKDRLVGGTMRVVKKYKGKILIITHRHTIPMLEGWKAMGFSPEKRWIPKYSTRMTLNPQVLLRR